MILVISDGEWGGGLNELLSHVARLLNVVWGAGGLWNLRIVLQRLELMPPCAQAVAAIDQADGGTRKRGSHSVEKSYCEMFYSESPKLNYTIYLKSYSGSLYHVQHMPSSMDFGLPGYLFAWWAWPFAWWAWRIVTGLSRLPSLIL